MPVVRHDAGAHEQVHRRAAANGQARSFLSSSTCGGHGGPLRHPLPPGRLRRTGSIARIAEFLGVPCSPALIERTASLSSFEFMSSPEQAHHFDDHFVRRHVLPKMGLPPDLPAAVSKVRRGGGTVGSKNTVPAHLRLRLERRWAETLQPATGCVSYVALRASYETNRPMTPHAAYAPERPRVTSGWFSR